VGKGGGGGEGSRYAVWWVEEAGKEVTGRARRPTVEQAPRESPPPLNTLLPTHDS
jgi:hypothetical protein